MVSTAADRAQHTNDTDSHAVPVRHIMFGMCVPIRSLTRIYVTYMYNCGCRTAAVPTSNVLCKRQCLHLQLYNSSRPSCCSFVTPVAVVAGCRSSARRTLLAVDAAGRVLLLAANSGRLMMAQTTLSGPPLAVNLHSEWSLAS